jgi:hypothetical protein
MSIKRRKAGGTVKLVSRLLSRFMRSNLSSGREAKSATFRAEALEQRTLMSISLQQIVPQTIPQGSNPVTFDLTSAFADATTQTADLMFSAKSDNSALLQTSLTGSNMTMTVAPAGSGFAHVTVSATAPDGSAASQTFRVLVSASADRSLDVPIGPGHDIFRYVEQNHTIGTIILLGPGSGTIHLGGDNLALVGNHARGANQEVESITLTGTTGATRLVISGVTRQRRTVIPVIGSITTDGAFGLVKIRTVNLVGDLTVPGGISNLIVDTAQNGTIDLGQSTASLRFTEGTFVDENFMSAAPIVKLRATQWLSSDSVPRTFTAAYIQSFFSAGTFDVGVQLSGVGAGQRTIGSIRVNGFIGGVWNIVGASAPLIVGGTGSDLNATFAFLPYISVSSNFGGSLTVPTLSKLRIGGSMVGAVLRLTSPNVNDLGQLVVRGVIQTSAIVSAGNLGPISAEALQQSVIYAGVGQLQQGQALPASVADLADTASIRSISLHPRRNVLAFFASDIAATTIGNLSLGTTRVANNSVQFGVAATSIGHILLRDLTNRRTINLFNITDPAALANQIAAQRLTLQDFVITVLQ